MSEPTFVPKELAQRWGVDLRTVRRRRILLRMQPQAFTGSVPVFTEAEVKRAERAWHRHMKRVLAEQSRRASRPRGQRAPEPQPEAPARLVTMNELRRAREAASR